jgi:hypothetical protein
MSKRPETLRVTAWQCPVCQRLYPVHEEHLADRCCACMHCGRTAIGEPDARVCERHAEHCTRLAQEWAAEVLRRDGRRTPTAWAEYREHEDRLKEPNQAVLDSTPGHLRQLLLDNPSWPMRGSMPCHKRAHGQADRG